MNLPPGWCAALAAAGWPAEHWSQVGDPCADDATIAAWARRHGHTLVTADLDFGDLLALTGATGPSVLLLRPGDVGTTPDAVVAALDQFRDELLAGAIVMIGGRAPSAYLHSLRTHEGVSWERLEAIPRSHLIDPAALQQDDLDGFIVDRASRLLDLIERATGKSVPGRDSEEVRNAFGAPLSPRAG